MATTSVLLDTNILMELFFNRAKSQAVVQAMTALPQDSINTISVLSLSTLLYYVEAENIDKTTAYAFLDGFKVLDMNNDDYMWAKLNDQGDFEDGLQVSCALRHGCQKLVTLDQKFKSMYGRYLAIQTIQ